MALIPPVCGGAFVLRDEPLSVEAAIDEVASDEAGAVATFIGTTRIHSRGRTVTHLDYEAYEGMAEQVMAEIAEELKRRYDLCEIAIHHRIGRVSIGERERRDRRLGAAPRRTRSPRARTRSTRSRSACRCGRKRCTRAARSGSAAGHR